MAVECGAAINIENNQGLTPLTTSAYLARMDMFFHIASIEREIYWQIGNVTCSAYPLRLALFCRYKIYDTFIIIYFLDIWTPLTLTLGSCKPCQHSTWLCLVPSWSTWTSLSMLWWTSSRSSGRALWGENSLFRCLYSLSSLPWVCVPTKKTIQNV